MTNLRAGDEEVQVLVIALTGYAVHSEDELKTEQRDEHEDGFQRSTADKISNNSFLSH